jgi:hypothetical protein
MCLVYPVVCVVRARVREGEERLKKKEVLEFGRERGREREIVEGSGG